MGKIFVHVTRSHAVTRSFLQRNDGAALLAAAAGDAHGALADAYDPTFDFAEYWAEHKADYPDLEKNYMAGHFDEVRSPAGWARRAFMLRENNTLDREIAAGGTVGLVVGLGASLFDVTNLIGAGAIFSTVRAASRLGRIGQGVAIGAAEGAFSDAVMQQLDPTQSWKDTVLNVGVGSLVGGALGSFVKHVPADSPLLPGHPENPMHPDNLGADPIHIIKPGQLAEEGTVIHSSGGAAAVSPETAARVAALEAHWRAGQVVEVLLTPAHEVVDDADFVALLDQQVRHVAAEEARASGDDCDGPRAHRAPTAFIVRTLK